MHKNHLKIAAIQELDKHELKEQNGGQYFKPDLINSKSFLNKNNGPGWMDIAIKKMGEAVNSFKQW